MVHWIEGKQIDHYRISTLQNLHNIIQCHEIIQVKVYSPQQQAHQDSSHRPSYPPS